MSEGSVLNLNITVPFSNEEEARIAYDSLRVDPEPKRSLCFKTLDIDKNILIAILEPSSAPHVMLYQEVRKIPPLKLVQSLYLDELLVHLFPTEMVLLENDAFLNELTKMFVKSRNSGSVTLTMKRYDGRDRHLPKDGSKNPDPQEYMCLIRATLAKSKISTVVHPKDVNKFQQAYCSLLRGNMDGLKKLKKTKLKSKTT